MKKNIKIKRRHFITSAMAGLAVAPSPVTAQTTLLVPQMDEQKPRWRGKTYEGPEVTLVYVEKRKKRLTLYHNQKKLQRYKVKFGFNPVGHKSQQGDGKTPEGVYFIDRRNYNSLFHLSLGISYPDAKDVALAQARGVDPGGDIFIHGGPRRNVSKRAFKKAAKRNWTAGCISLPDDEMTELFWMVGIGTPIMIEA